MNSISNTDFAVLEFLIRNFSELFTIRQIALKLKLSPAGVHKSLKKLEKDNILKSEKLGSGLFFRINFESNIAKHLCCSALLEKKESIDFRESSHLVKICISDNKSALVVTHDVESMKQELPKKDIKFHIVSDDEFIKDIKNRDKNTLQMIRSGKIVIGEEELFSTLKRGAFRI